MADHKSLTRLIKEEEEVEEEVEALHVLAPRQIIRNCLTDALKKTMMDLESQLSAMVAIPHSTSTVRVRQAAQESGGKICSLGIEGFDDMGFKSGGSFKVPERH